MLLPGFFFLQLNHAKDAPININCFGLEQSFCFCFVFIFENLICKLILCAPRASICIVDLYLYASGLFSLCNLVLILLQERIQAGREILEAKRIAEDNERKRYVLNQLLLYAWRCFVSLFLFSDCMILFSFWTSECIYFSQFFSLKESRERGGEKGKRENSSETRSR